MKMSERRRLGVGRLRGVPRLVLAAMAAAVAAAVVAVSLPGVAGAAPEAEVLTFGNTPIGWEVTVGTPDSRVGKISATGVKKKQIRYRVSGADGFAINRRGVVSYDGAALPSEGVVLEVTAFKRKHRSSVSATISIGVSVRFERAPQQQQPEPEPEPEAQEPEGQQQQGQQQQQNSGLKVSDTWEANSYAEYRRDSLTDEQKEAEDEEYEKFNTPDKCTYYYTGKNLSDPNADPNRVRGGENPGVWREVYDHYGRGMWTPVCQPPNQRVLKYKGDKKDDTAPPSGNDWVIVAAEGVYGVTRFQCLRNSSDHDGSQRIPPGSDIVYCNSKWR